MSPLPQAEYEGCPVAPDPDVVAAMAPVPNPNGWVSPWHFGINEGPIVAMVENYKSGLIWQLMRGCPYVVAGLRRAGFTGGWLVGLPSHGA